MKQGDSTIRHQTFFIAFATVMLAGIQASACSIPVFRFALENWRPDPYVAYVLHRGDVTAEQQALIDALQPTDFDGTASANLVVRTINVDVESAERVEELQAGSTDATLPQLVVQTPARQGEPETVFAGELTDSSATQLTGSPLRADIADRLLKGDSVVWVYLECGDAQKDDQLFGMLTQELIRLEGELKLPEIEEEDLDDLTASPESLRIQFSAVRLSRDDETEAVFRDMLLHVEHDLRDEPYAGQPMAFPVFGRGRALYALVGDGLAPDLIQEACEFLTGACQCTVKAENPGVDLLMQVEWDQFIQPTEAVDAALPPLAGFSGFGQQVNKHGSEISLGQNTAARELPDESTSSDGASGTQPVQPSPASNNTDTVDVDQSAESTVPTTRSSPVMTNFLYVLLLAGGAVVVATMFLMRRPGS